MKADTWRQAAAIQRTLQTTLADTALVRRGARLGAIQDALNKALQDVLPADRYEVLSTLRDMFPTDLGEPAELPGGGDLPEPDSSRPVPSAPPVAAAGASSATIPEADLLRKDLLEFCMQTAQLMGGVWGAFGEPINTAELERSAAAASGGDAAARDKFKKQLKDLLAREIAAIAGFAHAGREWAVGWASRLAPNVIKARVKRDAGMFARIEPKCWEEYEKVASGFTPEAAERDIHDSAAQAARDQYIKQRAKDGKGQ
jgi:hypothetical protein